MILKGKYRNLPCPCGSGKKYKKCCYTKDADTDFKRLLERDKTLKEIFNSGSLAGGGAGASEESVFDKLKKEKNES